MKYHRIIYGIIDITVRPDGSRIACVIRMTDAMILPEDLIPAIPDHVIANDLAVGNTYIIPDLFEGEITCIDQITKDIIC